MEKSKSLAFNEETYDYLPVGGTPEKPMSHPLTTNLLGNHYSQTKSEKLLIESNSVEDNVIYENLTTSPEKNHCKSLLFK